jgi:hypothetical protein
MTDTAWLLLFAAISALGDLMGIIKEISKQIRNTGTENSWYSRSVTLTARKILAFYVLGILSLVLSLLALHSYMAERQLPAITISESPVAEWGRISENTVFATVNTRVLSSLSNPYVLIMTCLVSDPTTDSMHDSRLEKSSTFEIRGDSLRIEMAPSSGFWARARQIKLSPDNKFSTITVHRVDLFLIAWPRHVPTDQLKVLADVEKSGGKILGNGGFMGPPL